MKTLAKAALCALYKYSGAMRLQEATARRRGRSFLAVLLFHRVTDAIPPDGLTVGTGLFRRICRMLRRGFRVVPLAEVFRLLRSGEAFPPRTVAVTFDDCYRDNLDAARVLAEHGLPACFFLPTAYVGTDAVMPWDRHLPRMPNLTWDEVGEMAALGHEIGSHTVTHPDMALVSEEQARRELTESKKVIEDRLARPVPPLLCGFFPLERQRRYKGLPVGVLRLWRHLHCFLGTPLLLARHAREALAALFDWLRADRLGAPLLELDHVTGDGPFQHLLLENLARHRRFSHVVEAHTRALLVRGRDAEDYLSRAVSGGSRKELRRQRKRLGEAGKLEWLALGPGDDVAAWVERFLEPLGADVDEGDGVCSDYLNVLAERGSEARVARALVRALVAGAFGGWHEVVLSAMDGGGVMPGLLSEALAEAGLRVSCDTTGAAPYVPLLATWDAYLKALSKKNRYSVTSALRRFEAWAEGTAELRRAGTPAELEEGKRVLQRLHGQRWREAGGTGAFAAPRFAAFHDAVMPRLLDGGALELAWLLVRGEPVAAAYDIVWNGKVLYYQCGWDCRPCSC
jgi:CelD/BcsL family acetyltransferase involved in cellulose biosynthesis